MRATVMYGAGDVRVEDVPDAAIKEPTDALVRVPTAGDPPADWDALFAALTPDAPDVLDAANDPDNLPLDAEPATVREDLERLRT